VSEDPGKEGRFAQGIPVVPAFDGYRAYAILAVVVLHLLIFSGVLVAAEGDWRFQLSQATVGQAVEVLFIVSGFVLFLPTAARGGESGDVRAYALRRAARLMPAYWATLAGVLVLIAAVPLSPPIDLPGVGSVAAHGLLLQTPVQLFEAVPMGFGVNGPVWTLSLEAIFYGLLPLVAGWYFRRPIAGLAVAAAVTAAWHELIVHYDSVVSVVGLDPSPETSLRLQTSALTQFPFFAFSFAAGMTGAWAYVRLRERQGERSTSGVVAIQVGALAALALFAYLIARESTGGGVVLGAEVGRRSSVVSLGFSASLATLMVATALAPGGLSRPFAHPAARRLGDISYGIYLSHMVVITYALGMLGLDDEDLAGSAATQARLVTGDGSAGTLIALAPWSCRRHCSMGTPRRGSSSSRSAGGPAATAGASRR